MADKNKAPKHTGTSKKSYLQRYNADAARARRAVRHKRRMARQAAKPIHVPRGTARRLRRMTPAEFALLWEHSNSPVFKGNFDQLLDVWKP